MWSKDLDILRHTGVRGPWDHPQQRPQLQRGLLVSGHPGVWAPYWQVRACAHLCFQSAVRPVIIHFITSISHCWFAVIVCWREQRAAEKHPFQQTSAKPKAQLHVCIFSFLLSTVLRSLGVTRWWRTLSSWKALKRWTSPRRSPRDPRTSYASYAGTRSRRQSNSQESSLKFLQSNLLNLTTRFLRAEYYSGGWWWWWWWVV